MRIAVLTSSRADFGIYEPLLKKLKNDPYFELTIIAFGTHLSHFHGYTIREIEKDFEVAEKLETLILGDTEEAISNATGNTITRFASLWQRLQNKIDIIFTLGDRYEMLAAALASVPFNLKIVHFYGGDITLGAIDNKFRDCLTTLSDYHFVSLKKYSDRIKSIKGTENGVNVIGILNLDELEKIKFLSKKSFQEKYNINLEQPTILSTFHPETVDSEKNIQHAKTLSKTFQTLSERYQIIITMPNNDTFNGLIRNEFLQLASENERIVCVENLGTIGYFSCMRHSVLLLGNTSSGITEAASFQKYVVNIGNRQEGRYKGKNVLDTKINTKEIIKAVAFCEEKNFNYSGENVFHTKGAVNKTIEILKKIKIDK